MSAAPAVAREPNDMTRYLCAGVHVDHKFCRDVLNDTLHERYRAIAPSHGVDLPLVVRHGVAASRRRRIRDAIVLGLLLTLLLPPMQTYRGVIAVLILVWTVVLAELCIVRFEILAPRLRRSSPDFDPVLRTGRRTRTRLADLESAPPTDVNVYSGFSPFVGWGVPLNAWSFVVDTTRGKDHLGQRSAPQPFGLADLYDEVATAVERLGIPGLTVCDELYVNGQFAADLPEILPDPFGRPVSSCSPETLRAVVGGFSESVRHYRCFRVAAWGGEIVLSIFLRFTAVRGRLFVEGVYYLLTPAAEKYHVVDDLPGTPTPLQVLTLVRDSVVMTIPRLVLAPFRLPAELIRAIGRAIRRWEDRLTITNGHVFDYGARRSVRARGASTDYRRYFQKLDREMYGKYVERQILETIVNFLDARGIDTSDLVERQTTILNQGVMVSGGSLVAENLAVGRGARIANVLRAGRGGKTRAPRRGGPSTAT